MNGRFTVIFLLAILLFGLTACISKKSVESDCNACFTEIHKLEYHNPDITVELDVGFKSVPMPMDFDGDGDMDLLVSESGSYAESGVFYFENISGNTDNPLFRYGMRVNSERFRLGYDGMCFRVSEVNGHIHVLTPDRVNDKLLIYRDVPQNVFWDREELPLPAKGYVPNTKYNVWRMIDFDGDGVHDLICSLQSKRGDFILFFKNRGTDKRPEYANPHKVRIKNSSGVIIGKAAFADFDNDGDYDFVAVDQFATLFYFENSGTKEKYEFIRGRPLSYKDRNLQFYSHYGSAIKLQTADYNRDGKVDIIAGCEPGRVSFVKNTGEMKDGLPLFLPPNFFRQKAKFVDFGALSAPRVFDWDDDGLDDIIAGNGPGNIAFFKNLGGKTPKWAAPQLLKADGQTIRILPPRANWGYVTIDVGDWDHDGLPDIMANHIGGNVIWYKNIGTRSYPKLAAAKPIEVQWKNGKPLKPKWTLYDLVKENELLAQWRTSPLIMDFNKDGLNDLVMLDYEGYLAVYLRYKENGKLLLSPPQRYFIYPNGKEIRLNQLEDNGHGGRLKITFADWDGDGRQDLIFSSKPAVDWMRNLGMKNGKMVLQYMGRIISRTLMGHTDGPVVCDWNRDGVPDLLVGTETGVFYYWRRPNINVTTTMTTAGKQMPANYPYFKR